MSRDADGRWTDEDGCKLDCYSTGINSSSAMAAVSSKIIDAVIRSDLWPGAGEDERDYSPETP